MCDVAGAGGHVNGHSSIVYTELTHRAMQAVAEVILSNKSPHEMYAALVDKRAVWLGVDPKDPMKEVLARVGAMMRLTTPEEGSMLKKAVAALDPADREQIKLQFSGQKQGPTPTYMPTVLVNLYGALEGSQEEKLMKTVALGMPLLARVLEMHGQSAVRLNFNPVAAVAKQHPSRLRSSFSIDSEGNVTLLESDLRAAAWKDQKTSLGSS